ncbi:MAG: hypothetical protein JHC41_08045 [Nitrosopumilus sp.]|nr:hypothetical protein [Nitrosopumilus sp.]
MLSNIFLASELAFDVGQIINLAIIIFSLVLFALAITAYRNTKIKKIAFAAAAFALFAIQLAIEYVDEVIHLSEDQIDVMLSLITLGILLLFFFAVVKK